MENLEPRPAVTVLEFINEPRSYPGITLVEYSLVEMRQTQRARPLGRDHR